ncbi:MAG: hypothetical protein JO307_08585 [Bryobacterales bacterium]|nr:hypothetical protein [Bryobacterales bacterium]MBV9398472.1 hypothetical protein [Bryobacterales bacterium]
MQLNLNSLRAQIEEHLESRGIVVFPSLPRAGDIGATVHWDTTRNPDFKAFVAAAEAAGVRMMTLFARELEDDLIEDTLEQLGSLNFDRDERRVMESRLREMRAYAGFTCEIELSFDQGARVFVFDLQTEWFSDLNDLIDQIEDLYDTEDHGEDEDDDLPFGGRYLPRN